jgi:uncharacterized protein (DUF2141 family)
LADGLVALVPKASQDEKPAPARTVARKIACLKARHKQKRTSPRYTLMRTLLLCFSLLLPLLSVAQGQLTIDISNIQHTDGKALLIGIYKDTDEFPKVGKNSYFKKVVPKESSVSVTLDLPPGNYAIGLIHDLNGNQKLDKNWVGYPTEPFAFSRDFKPLMGPPSFSDCQIEVKAGKQRISIKLL